MHARPISVDPDAAVRIVPFNPFADHAGVAIKRNAILAQLSEERSKSYPNTLLVKAYEIWLRVYDRNTTIRSA
jgi:hypothetical protein